VWAISINIIIIFKEELLLSGKYTVYDISKKAIHEFYIFAGKEVVKIKRY